MDKLVRAQAINDFRPPVKSKVLKLAGDKRGIVLINYRSLLDFLDSLPSGQEKEA